MKSKYEYTYAKETLLKACQLYDSKAIAYTWAEIAASVSVADAKLLQKECELATKMSLPEKTNSTGGGGKIVAGFLIETAPPLPPVRRSAARQLAGSVQSGQVIRRIPNHYINELRKLLAVRNLGIIGRVREGENAKSKVRDAFIVPKAEELRAVPRVGQAPKGGRDRQP